MIPGVVFIALLFAGISPGLAQEAVQEEVRLRHEFGEELIFEARFEIEPAIEQGSVYMRVEGELDTRVAAVEFTPPDRLTLRYTFEDRPIRAFSEIEYWFELTLVDGSTYTSKHYSHYYEDNRFEWQERTQAEFRVHWYEGNEAYGQSLLDVAIIGREKVRTILPLETPEKIDIYAYASGVDMRTALQLAGLNWVGAHTDPDLNVMVLSLPPGPEQRFEMERQIPHELMHIMLYNRLEGAYTRLPIWLNEGLASIAELYPNPDYLVVLENATEKETLLPLETLCTQFPRDASGAYLAYAEAESFTRYLYNQYGSSELENLVSIYEDGIECQRGFEIAFGTTLRQLERNWQREALDSDPLVQAAINLSPWITISLVVIVVPLALTAVLWRRMLG